MDEKRGNFVHQNYTHVPAVFVNADLVDDLAVIVNSHRARRLSAQKRAAEFDGKIDFDFCGGGGGAGSYGNQLQRKYCTFRLRGQERLDLKKVRIPSSVAMEREHEPTRKFHSSKGGAKHAPKKYRSFKSASTQRHRSQLYPSYQRPKSTIRPASADLIFDMRYTLLVSSLKIVSIGLNNICISIQTHTAVLVRILSV